MNCDICGAKEGELHRKGCYRETCPLCGDKISSCDCIYDLTGLRNRAKYQERHQYLSRKVYREGPPDWAITAMWALIDDQRIPFTGNDIPAPMRDDFLTSES